MTGPEQGFLLLSSHLGDPQRKVLTVAQLRTLAQRVRQMDAPTQNREMNTEDLIRLGYDRNTAHRILGLLADTQQLQWYVSKGQRSGCYPITRVSSDYPPVLKTALGMDAPGCLWAKGDISILDSPTVSLVGSRDLSPANRIFAREAGRQAALQGFTLVSGNARGADQTAQDACLNAGGKVISIVADRLDRHPDKENVLYLSEDGFDLDFSTPRALSRNRVIHALSPVVLVAQCTLESGGTWDGTTRNLQRSWSPVYCMDDGSAAMQELAYRGASLISMQQLSNLSALMEKEQNFIDQ
ncbi:MAG: DNA-protecting protein DprA [Oscillospiraceae bacterium]|nr:DNA-protecting protein DprA [Oscillospiraceae bacterium]